MESEAALPCGCIPGYFLCPQAEALWAQVNAAYRQFSGWRREHALASRAEVAAQWTSYQERIDRYNEHFTEQSHVA